MKDNNAGHTWSQSTGCPTNPGHNLSILPETIDNFSGTHYTPQNTRNAALVLCGVQHDHSKTGAAEL